MHQNNSEASVKEQQRTDIPSVLSICSVFALKPTPPWLDDRTASAANDRLFIIIGMLFQFA